MTGVVVILCVVCLAVGWIVGSALAAMALVRRRQGPPDLADYTRSDDPGGSGDYIAHLGGVDWGDAPVPPRRHTCWPQTTGRFGGDLVDRCACGGYRDRDLGVWTERNTRTPRTPVQQAAHDRGKAVDKLIDDYHTAETALAGGQGPPDVMRARLAEIREQVRELLSEQENAGG